MPGIKCSEYHRVPTDILVRSELLPRYKTIPIGIYTYEQVGPKLYYFSLLVLTALFAYLTLNSLFLTCFGHTY